MAFEPFVWNCQPVENAAWTKVVDGACGAYTPCAINSVVISISHLVPLGLCCYHIWLIKKNSKVQMFTLRSKCYNYMLGLLDGYSTIEPLLRLLMDILIFNLNGETGLAHYEATSLIIEATAWCSVLIMIGLEAKSYIREFRWYVRFGVFMVGDAVLLNLILPVKDLYSRFYLGFF
ncbi:ABC transporter C family member 12-like isoform X2 [Durio zibethinus]|uniref:ABC transporter C family member 12-like isoform X2 n=1 Tax=Durio zibethinus TaxID=66656 RepID=A0A6P6ACS5_DURZI|nr:ABC transporter C family member 12-like isoform X2 [Durio zibethinus]